MGNLSPLSESEASLIEVYNLTLVRLSFNFKTQVPTDMSADKSFLPTENINSQSILNKISQWTYESEMKYNPSKTKYLIIHFCKLTQFNKRLYHENSLIEPVKEIKLLGVIITEDLSWQANTDMIVKKAFKRMCIMVKLFEFKVKLQDLKQIYTLYIRSIVEQSCVVWSNSLT